VERGSRGKETKGNAKNERRREGGGINAKKARTEKTTEGIRGEGGAQEGFTA
jgi:hypothetical protein